MEALAGAEDSEDEAAAAVLRSASKSLHLAVKISSDSDLSLSS